MSQPGASVPDETGPLETTASLLKSRVEALRERLDHAAAAIGPAPAFVAAINASRTRLDGSAHPSAGAWNTLSVREQKAANLFREVLAYLQAKGAVAWPEGGCAALARGLVAELCGVLSLGQPPVIAPDVEDSFSDFVQIIRLRYPTAGIWDVPIVAHELGHFAAYRLTSWEDGLQRSQEVRAFIDDYLRRKDDLAEAARESWRYRLNEFFADAFATYCAGPCYAASALLLRFDPAQARNDGDPRHPSYAARAAVILETLREMGRDGSYALVLKELESRWNGLLEFLEQSCDVQEAQRIARRLYSVVENLAQEAQYRGWSRADNTLQYVLTDNSRTWDGPVSARDLLNAAWIARAAGADPGATSKRALQIWHEHRP